MKRKHCEVIKAWADGAKIQIKTNFGEWIDKACDPLWMDCYEYRVKPETVRYRVALAKNWDGDVYAYATGTESEAEFLGGQDNFVRWLTDWQEVEV